jgi:hypothetical protein
MAAGDEAFERLRANLHPETGEKLTPRANEYREASYVEAHKALVEKWRYQGKNGEPSSWKVENHRVTMPLRQTVQRSLTSNAAPRNRCRLWH